VKNLCGKASRGVPGARAEGQGRADHERWHLRAVSVPGEAGWQRQIQTVCGELGKVSQSPISLTTADVYNVALKLCLMAIPLQVCVFIATWSGWVQAK